MDKIKRRLGEAGVFSEWYCDAVSGVILRVEEQSAILYWLAPALMWLPA